MTQSSTRILIRTLLVGGCLVSMPLLAASDTSGLTLEQRLKRLERIADEQDITQLQFNIERLQREAESLRGELDETTHELQQLKRQQKELYLDLDQRLQQIETQGATSAVVPRVGGAVGAPINSGEVFDDAGGLAAPDRGEPAGELTLDEAGMYQKAFSHLKAGEYQEALTTFQAFLQTYPQGLYSDNAQYWLGEVHYVMHDYSAAITEFGKVVSNFPDSAKVPDAHLKTGFAYYELKDWKKASQSLLLVVERYPASSAARLAERRIQQMKLDGQL